MEREFPEQMEKLVNPVVLGKLQRTVELELVVELGLDLLPGPQSPLGRDDMNLFAIFQITMQMACIKSWM